MGKIVLIVDDDTSVRESLKLLLEDKYSPISVSNGKDALNILDKRHIDIVLLDIQMPEMDGLETLKRIRQRYDCVIVIMLTVVEDKKTRNKAFELGANNYIYKPYKKEKLLFIIETALKKKMI